MSPEFAQITRSLRGGMDTLVNVDPHRVYYGEKLFTDSFKPFKTKPDLSRVIAGYGIHQHQTGEICIPISGQMTMHIRDRVFTMTHGDLFLVPPGLPHSEGYFKKSDSYAAMWVQFASDSTLALLLSEYHPKTRWQCPYRYILRDKTARTFQKMLEDHACLTPEHFEKIRAMLLHVFAAIYQETIDTRRQDEKKQQFAHHQNLLTMIKEYLDHHYTKPINVESIAAFTRLSPNYVNTLFSQWQGQGIHDYLITLRMQRAMMLCQKGGLLIKEIAHQCGYEDPLYFSRAFYRFHRCRPTDILTRT